MHRRIRLLALTTAVLVSFSLSRAEQADNTALPLPEDYFPGLKSLIDQTLRESPRMIARNTEEVIAQENVVSARSGQLPTVGGYFSYNPYDRQVREGSPTTRIQRIGYNASLTQPIFAWGALSNTTRMYELQAKIAQGLTAESYRGLVYEVRAAYLQLVMRKAGMARARYNQKIAEDQYAVAKSKREKNVISQADLFGPSIAADQARLAADRAQDDYENSKLYLSKLTGTTALADDAVPDEIPAVTPGSTAIQDIASSFMAQPEFDTYVLQNTRRQIEVEKLGYKINNTRLLPKLSGSIGVSQDQQKLTVSGGIPYMVRDYYIGGTVSWTIFDGFASHAAKAQALARRRQLERTLQAQTSDLLAAVKSQVKQIDFAARNLAITEQLLGSAKNVEVASKEDVQRGIGSEAAANSAELSYYDQRIAAYNARYDYMMKVSDFLSTVMKDRALDALPVQYRR